MVHEPYVPLSGWRGVLMGLWQRAQLRVLSGAADVVFCSTERFTTELETGRYAKRLQHLGVASNLPDMRSSRDAARAELGVVNDGLVIAMLGTGHPSRIPGHLVRAIEAVVSSRGEVVVLNLGDGAPPLERLPPEVSLHQPGRQSAEDLARFLSSADLFLAPFVDGVSMRRGSIMAALQHGIAVIGTDGSITDSLIRRHCDALCLVPVDRPDRFAEAAAKLARDRDGREALGAAGRSLYERCLDWPIIARRIVETMQL